MQGPNEVPKFLKFFYTFGKSRSSKAAAKDSDSDSSSGESKSPLYAGSSRTPHSILQESGYKISTRESFDKSAVKNLSQTSLSSLMLGTHDFIQSLLSNQTDEVVQFASLIANDLRAPQEVIAERCQAENKAAGEYLHSVFGSSEHAVDFYQSVESALSLVTRDSHISTRGTAIIHSQSAPEGIYLNFVLELTTILYAHWFKSDAIRALPDHENKVKLIISQALQDGSFVLSSAARRQGYYETLSQLTGKLRYRNEIVLYLDLCSDYKGELLWALEKYKRKERHDSSYSAVQNVLVFLNKVPEGERQGVLHLFIQQVAKNVL
jgi:hypothetical protein